MLRAIAIVVIGLALGCGGDVPPEAPAVARPIKMVNLGVAGGGILEFPGRVAPAQQADLAFEVSGKIIEFPVIEGQEVLQGDLIARLDPRDFDAQRDAANARKAQAEADRKRAQQLFKADVLSKRDLELAERDFEVAEANWRKSMKALEDADLRAPFNGTVARKLVEDFANVQAKQVIAELQDNSSLEVKVAVPESDMANAKPGLTAAERSARVNTVVTISSLPDRNFPARIQEIATAADPVTRTFEVTVAFETPKDVTVAQGMTAQVRVTVPDDSPRESGFGVPSQSIVPDDRGGAFVWRIDPESMQVSKVAVEVGPLGGDRARINGQDLRAGDLIAASGVHHLVDGQPVRRFGE